MRQFPDLAHAIADLEGPDRTSAVRRLVEAATQSNGLNTAELPVVDAKTLVRELDQVAWDLQGVGSSDYPEAFRRARAANAYLDLLEGRGESAAYEAVHALGADEDSAIGLVRGGR
jgi:hypothetical protein